MPEVKFRRPEGTYLAWLDFESYGWNKEELKTRIDEIQHELFGNSSLYTEESWTVYENGMTAAMVTRDNAEATQAEVDAALATLNSGYDQLVTKSAQKLAEAITAAEGAIADLPAVEDLTLEDVEAVAEAKALVAAV